MKRLLLVALMVLATLVGMVGFSCAGDAVSATANATIQSVGTLQATVNDGDGLPVRARMYYLTASGFTGNDAITACDSGFHMASISEIQAPGNLQYVPRRTPAYDSADGMTAEEAQKWYRTPAPDSPAYDDQGSSPPTDHTGWVRPGANIIVLESPPADCSLYHSSSDQQNGTTMTLHTLWGDSYMDPAPAGPTGPAPWWQVFQQTCSLPTSVWCFENP